MSSVAMELGAAVSRLQASGFYELYQKIERQIVKNANIKLIRLKEQVIDEVNTLAQDYTVVDESEKITASLSNSLTALYVLLTLVICSVLALIAEVLFSMRKLKFTTIALWTRGKFGTITRNVSKTRVILVSVQIKNLFL